MKVTVLNTQRGTPHGNCNDPVSIISGKKAKIESLLTIVFSKNLRLFYYKK
jgi:hypothetical protein